MISKSEFSDSVLSSSSPVCDSRGGISGSSSESVRSCFLCIELTVVGSRVGHLEQDLVNQWPKLELWCICSRHREKIFLFYAGDNQMDRITSELSALPIYWKDISEVRSNCLRKPRRAEKKMGKFRPKKYKFSKNTNFRSEVVRWEAESVTQNGKICITALSFVASFLTKLEINSNSFEQHQNKRITRDKT